MIVRRQRVVSARVTQNHGMQHSNHHLFHDEAQRQDRISVGLRYHHRSFSVRRRYRMPQERRLSPAMSGHYSHLSALAESLRDTAV